MSVGSNELHVLHLNLARRWGGAEKRVLDIALHADRPLRSTIATLDGSPLFSRSRHAAQSVVAVGSSRADFRIVRRLEQVIDQTGVHVIDAHNRQSYLWGSVVARRTGTPLVATVHHSFRAEPGVRRWLDTLMIRLAAWSGAHFVAVSADVERALLETGIQTSRVEVIHAGLGAVSVDEGRPTFEPGWDHGRPFTVCAVGSLLPVKGHTTLLRAMRLLVEDGRDVECVIAGEGRRRRPLRRLAVALGIERVVRFVGFVPDVTEILRSADVFCLPSLSEGLPYAALEAVIAGVPAVMSEVGAIPDLFVHEESARLAPPGDERALARELGWIHDNPADARAMAQRARRDLTSSLDMRTTVARTRALYERARADTGDSRLP